MVVLVIALSIIGAGVGVTMFVDQSAKSGSTAVSVMGRSSSWGLVGHPVEYNVEEIVTEPYRGPYSYQWDYGDNTIQDGSNVSVHTFTSPGHYHPRVVISGKNGWSHSMDWSITIFGPDSLNTVVLDTGRCDWSPANEGDLYLNLTVWNMETFPVEIYPSGFSLADPAGDVISARDNQTLTTSIPAGGYASLTVFFPWDAGIPVRLSYYALFDWPIDLEEE